MAAHDWQQRIRTVWWQEDACAAVCLLDQSLLPQQVSYLHLYHEREVAEAITKLKVRGAPAIGVTAAFGVALGMYRLVQEQGSVLTSDEVSTHLRGVADLLKHTRPTAVNLSWAIERMMRCAGEAINEQVTPVQLVALLRDKALQIAAEDAAACQRMGELGAELIHDGDTLLTHCNAGALAATGLGTALAPIYVAHNEGKRIHVFVDETRPVLQGARLTAWELQQQGVPLTLITDNMAGHFMRHGGIKAIFVGADRIAANGDVANKIGTYSVAILAHAHHLPFYVVAPCSTIDSTLPGGEYIPIEQRNPLEVTEIRGVEIAPPGVQVANPAFDITPHNYIRAIITERGIARPPFDVSLGQIDAMQNEIGKVSR